MYILLRSEGQRPLQGIAWSWDYDTSLLFLIIYSCKRRTQTFYVLMQRARSNLFARWAII